MQARAAAEEAIRALGRGDYATARTFIAEGVAVDSGLAPLADIIHLACAEIETDGDVTVATWNALADAAASQGLVALVESSRH